MTAPDGDADFARVRELLAGHNTLTLATSGESGAWAASVFYASDERCNLYFVSDPKTRHGQDMSRTARVVAAINRDAAGWDEVIGLQLEGQVAILTGIARATALATYLAKFVQIRRIFESPREASEKLIAARLQGTAFWCLKPEWIRLIDSTRGFGWKREFRL
ncbi:MAG: pyridoxamine 5'-phosphate oxidase family protein [Gammaproteobacteria bacterium]